MAATYYQLRVFYFHLGIFNLMVILNVEPKVIIRVVLSIDPSHCVIVYNYLKAKTMPEQVQHKLYTFNFIESLIDCNLVYIYNYC
jgi:hypothetical protein